MCGRNRLEDVGERGDHSKSGRSMLKIWKPVRRSCIVNIIQIIFIPFRKLPPSSELSVVVFVVLVNSVLTFPVDPEGGGECGLLGCRCSGPAFSVVVVGCSESLNRSSSLFFFCLSDDSGAIVLVSLCPMATTFYIKSLGG